MQGGRRCREGGRQRGSRKDLWSLCVCKKRGMLLHQESKQGKLCCAAARWKGVLRQPMLTSHTRSPPSRRDCRASSVAGKSEACKNKKQKQKKRNESEKHAHFSYSASTFKEGLPKKTFSAHFPLQQRMRIFITWKEE